MAHSSSATIHHSRAVMSVEFEAAGYFVSAVSKQGRWMMLMLSLLSPFKSRSPVHGIAAHI